MMVEHGQLLIENKAVKEFNDEHRCLSGSNAHLSETFQDFYSISRYSTLKPEYGDSFSPFLFPSCAFVVFYLRIYGSSLALGPERARD
jgi:hypothetical protein